MDEQGTDKERTRNGTILTRNVEPRVIPTAFQRRPGRTSAPRKDLGCDLWVALALSLSATAERCAPGACARPITLPSIGIVPPFAIPFSHSVSEMRELRVLLPCVLPSCGPLRCSLRLQLYALKHENSASGLTRKRSTRLRAHRTTLPLPRAAGAGWGRWGRARREASRL